MSIPVANLVANFAGRAWAMLLNVLAVPIYIKLLGVEAYGLIGFFATLQAAFGIIDLGLSLTLNREFARAGRTPQDHAFMRNLLRTLETVYWSISVCAGLLVVVLASWIAQHWISAQGLSHEQVAAAIRAMGCVILLQTPLGLYEGGFAGLQRQVELNVMLAVAALLRAAGAILALLLIERTVVVFFAWQVVVAAVVAVCFVQRLWSALPRSGGRPHFDSKVLARIWRFSAVVSSSAILGLALTQLDKVVLSKFLPLEEFAYYTLATTASGFLWAIVVPMTAAFFPRFAQLATEESPEALAKAYHTACQLLATLILPSAAVVCLYAQDLLLIWTRNEQVAVQAAGLLSLLVIGTALNGLASAASALQTAVGWPNLVMYTNVGLVLFVVPALLIGVRTSGATGAAVVWILVNMTYLVITVPLMHRRVLKGEFRRWLGVDLLMPLSLVAAAAVLSSWIYPATAAVWFKLAFIAAAWLAMLLIAAVALPNVRTQLIRNRGWTVGAALAARGGD